MDPDRSSRVAARRIVEEVLADHAARATALDGATPVAIVERPDTPSWRAARRIVEETLAEHAARAVVPPTVQLDVVVDLEERDIEVVVDLDGHAPETEPRTEQVSTGDPSPPAVVSVVEPIQRDETAAKAARRVAEEVLTEQDIDPDAPTGPHDAPTAFEIDPVPAAPPEPPEPIATGVAVEPEPSETDDAGDPDPRDDAGPAEPRSDEDEPTEVDESPAPDGADGRVVPVDDERLRAAIPERLFALDPEPVDADTPLDGTPALGESGVVPTDDDPPSPRTPESVTPAPLGPDAPVVIAARIVEDVLADRERAAQASQEAQQAREARDAEVAALAAEIDGPEPPEQGAASVAEAELGTGPMAPAAPPAGVAEGRAAVPSGPGSASGVMTVDAGVEDPPVLDPVAPEPRVDDLPAEAPDEFWVGQEAADPAAEDEFGGWPEPIAPPRRTGRWLITTVLGAVLLAVLLPLAIGALRDLLSFS